MYKNIHLNKTIFLQLFIMNRHQENVYKKKNCKKYPKVQYTPMFFRLFEFLSSINHNNN